MKEKNKEKRRLIWKSGFTSSELAKEYGCSKEFFSDVLTEKQGSVPLQDFISERTGMSLEELFPKYARLRKLKTAMANIGKGIDEISGDPTGVEDPEDTGEGEDKGYGAKRPASRTNQAISSENEG